MAEDILPSPDPGGGELTGYIRLSKQLSLCAEALATTQTRLTANHGQLSGMTSVAIARSRDVLTVLATQAGRLRVATELSRGLIRGYLRDREHLQLRSAKLRRKVESSRSAQVRALARLRSAAAAANSAASGGTAFSNQVSARWNEPIAALSVAPEARPYAMRWNAEVAELARLRVVWQRLQHERERLDRRVATALRSAASGLRLLGSTGVMGSVQLANAGLAPMRLRAEALRSALADIANNGAAKQVAASWASLSAADRQLLITRYPQLIGPLAGVDANSRDQANRLLVAQALADPLIHSDTKAEIRQLLNAVTGEHDPPRRLLKFALADDSDDQDGRQLRIVAAVGVGDTDSAELVTVACFGMNSSAGKPAGSLRGMSNLVTAANSPERQVAAIAWWGYDSPTAFEEPFTDKAIAGGKLLAKDVDAFITGRAKPVKIAAFGHSYGSLTWIEALRRVRNRDAIAVYITAGAPGVQRDASDVVDEIPAYALNASRDSLSKQGYAVSAADRTLPIQNRLQVVPAKHDSATAGYLNIRTTMTGFTELSAEAGANTSATTSHSLITAKQNLSDRGYLSKGTTALAAVAGVVSSFAVKPSATTDAQTKRERPGQHHPDTKGQPQVHQAQTGAR